MYHYFIEGEKVYFVDLQHYLFVFLRLEGKWNHLITFSVNLSVALCVCVIFVVRIYEFN